jgi:hypothetical protein
MNNPEVEEATPWRDETAITVDRVVDEHILPVSRNSAYEAVRRGEIPSLRLGGRILVPTIPLRRLLGELV